MAYMSQPACIRHTEIPGTSKLFADFAYHFERVKGFYAHDPHNPAAYTDAASEIDYPDDRRKALVAALEKQNGPSEALKKLAQPGTVAVVTGQQVGLFSGPAYTIYKALTAARIAKRLSDGGTPAVPVFWLATEDHDLAEVDHVWVFGKSHSPHMLRVTAAPTRPRPVGPVRVDAPPIDELRTALVGLPFANEVVAMVEDAYPSGATLGGGFQALLKTLLSKQGLLFLDPLDPSIRTIGAPFMAKALKNAAELRPALMERNEALTAAGYHAQVHVDAKTSLFFKLEKGERIPLRLKDSEFAALTDQAETISPNALLRPVWQDYLLPTVAYVGGPGELAYLAQSQVLYQQLLGRMPVATSRNGFTILDSQSAKRLDKFGLSVAQVFTNEESLKERIAACLVPASVVQKTDAAVADTTRTIDRLRTELQAFDPTLAAALEKSRSKIVYQMEKIRKKTAREVLHRDAQAAYDARCLAQMIYPYRHPQERFYSILPFLAQHGPTLIDRLAQAAELDCPDHCVLQA